MTEEEEHARKHIVTVLKPRGAPQHIRRKGSLTMMESGHICITGKNQDHHKFWLLIKPETIDMLYEAKKHLVNEGDKWTPPDPKEPS